MRTFGVICLTGIAGAGSSYLFQYLGWVTDPVSYLAGVGATIITAVALFVGAVLATEYP